MDETTYEIERRKWDQRAHNTLHSKLRLDAIGKEIEKKSSGSLRYRVMSHGENGAQLQVMRRVGFDNIRIFEATIVGPYANPILYSDRAVSDPDMFTIIEPAISNDRRVNGLHE